MARIRYIKPGIMTNEDLVELGPYAYILFTGLWMLADREGRLEYRPRRIKALAMPLWDDIDAGAVEDLIDGLWKSGFLNVYEVDENRYIEIAKWKQHQHPDPRERDSMLPAPPSRNGDSLESTRKHIQKTLESQCQDIEAPRLRRVGNGNTGNGNTGIVEPRARVGAAEVQRQLAAAAADAGFACAMEYPLPSVKLSSGHTLTVRADVAVLQNGEAAILIECKDYWDASKGRACWEITRQYKKYQATGIPFLLCSGIGEITATIDQIRAIISAKPATPTPKPEPDPEPKPDPEPIAPVVPVVLDIQARIAARIGGQPPPEAPAPVPARKPPGGAHGQPRGARPPATANGARARPPTQHDATQRNNTAQPGMRTAGEILGDFEPPRARSGPVRDWWPHEPGDVALVRDSMCKLAALVHLPPPDDALIRRVFDVCRGARGDAIHAALVGLWKRNKFAEIRSWGLVPLVVGQWFAA